MGYCTSASLRMNLLRPTDQIDQPGQHDHDDQKQPEVGRGELVSFEGHDEADAEGEDADGNRCADGPVHLRAAWGRPGTWCPTASHQGRSILPDAHRTGGGARFPPRAEAQSPPWPDAARCRFPYRERHGDCDRRQEPAHGVRRPRGRARHRPHRRLGRGLRRARAQRRGQDDHDRDPRGLPPAQRGRRACSRRRPRASRSIVARTDRRRLAAELTGGGADRGGDASPLRRVLRHPGASRSAPRVVRAAGPGIHAQHAALRAANSAGSMSRSRSSGIPCSCSSTSRPPASTRRRGEAHGA